MKSVLTLLLLVLSNQALGAEFILNNLDLEAGFSQRSGAKSQFGHLATLRIGALSLSPDLLVYNPVSQTRSSVVGVLASFSWGSGLRDQMAFVVHISKANRDKLEKFRKTGMIQQASGDLSFIIFERDPSTESYYAKLRTFTLKKKGILHRIGSKMPEYAGVSLPIAGSFKKEKLLVADNASSAVRSTVSFPVQITLEPWGDQPQELIFASSPDQATKIIWNINK